MTRILGFISLIMSILWLPQMASAHATLIEASPSAGSHLIERPNEVVLIFNETIGKEHVLLKVFDQSRQLVTDRIPQVQDGRQVRLELPRLSDGAYTVTYHVVSGDGHPVRGSYIFLVGNARYPAVTEPTGAGGFQEEIYAARVAYYFALLMLTGWIYWGIFFRIKNNERARKKYGFTALILQQVHLLCLIVLLALEWLGYSTSVGIPLTTGYGLSWLLSTFLSLIGFTILFRSKWVDGGWIVLLLLAKSLNGHSILYGPPFITSFVDLMHLLAAAIWCGGLLFIMVLWKRERLLLTEFILLFSKHAFWSLVSLVITGFVMTYLFLSELSYLLYTTWGGLLLTKTILVFLVVFVASRIRKVLAHRPLRAAWTWLKADFSIMVFIVSIVGVLTYLSPLPANTPITWEVERDAMTLSINPGAPGENQFRLDVQEGTIKRAELFLSYKEDQEIAPISVPIRRGSNEENGFVAEGYYLPFPGEWEAELRILNSHDEEVVFKKRFRLFPTEDTK